MATTALKQTSNDQQVIRLYRAYNQGAPGANTAIVSGGFTVSDKCAKIRVTVALTTESVLNLTATDGSTAHKWGLNASTALTAGNIFTFEHAVIDSDGTNTITYNLEVETDGVVEMLVVDEIQGT